MASTPRRRPAATVDPGSVAAAIRQTRPFRSKAQEAFVALLLTAEAVRWPLHDLLARHQGLTLQQYNVLRILRGAGAAGLPTLAIGERMIERMDFLRTLEQVRPSVSPAQVSEYEQFLGETQRA